MFRLFLLATCLVGGLAACSAPDSATATEAPAEEAPTPPPADPFLIGEDSFYGLTPGDALADHGDRLTAFTLQTGEGDFAAFRIQTPGGEELGYVLPDPNDASRIGDIYLTDPRVRTAAGIHVGTSLAELEEVRGTLPIHGSEIEGMTMAADEKLMYVLDANFWSYDVDRNQIPADTRIKEIILGR